MFSAIVQFLSDLCSSDPPDSSAGDAEVLLNSLNFEFILCLESVTPLFMETAVASNMLQSSTLDLVAASRIIQGISSRIQQLRTDDEFRNLFVAAEAKATEAGIEIPTAVPGQARKRRVPARYRESSSADHDHSFASLEDFYRATMYVPFLDRMQEELTKRFLKYDDSTDCTDTGKILWSLYSLTDREMWQGATANDAAREALNTICQFYDCEEEQFEQKLQAELRVFHTSYESPRNDVKGMLDTMKKHSLQDVFPTLLYFLKIYATIPATTSVVERSFSKLKIVKSRLRSLCKQERLSELLMLSIEKDIPVDESEVINHFKCMADRSAPSVRL